MRVVLRLRLFVCTPVLPPLDLHVLQLAIHISHHSVKQGDRGMIVIGGTVTFGAVGAGEQDSVDDGADAVDAELQFEDYSVVHSKSGTITSTFRPPCTARQDNLS